MLRFWRVRRFLRHLLAESLYLRLKPQIGLFLLGEFSWHRQAGAGTCWQLFDGGRSILLDHASPCHVSAPTPPSEPRQADDPQADQAGDRQAAGGGEGSAVRASPENHA